MSRSCQISSASILGVKLSEFNTRNVFMPGVGTPYAMITSEALLFNISTNRIRNFTTQ